MLYFKALIYPKAPNKFQKYLFSYAGASGLVGDTGDPMEPKIAAPNTGASI